MRQVVPSDSYNNIPCTIVACGCGLDYFRKCKGGQSKFDVINIASNLAYHSDGYLTLQGTNRLVRSLFKVTRGGYMYFKRGTRPKLSEYDFEGKNAIVMVLGHCIFVTGNEYHSFFENGNDDIVAIWFVDGE